VWCGSEAGFRCNAEVWVVRFGEAWSPLRMKKGSEGFLIPWGCLKDRDVTPNKKAMT